MSSQYLQYHIKDDVNQQRKIEKHLHKMSLNLLPHGNAERNNGIKPKELLSKCEEKSFWSFDLTPRLTPVGSSRSCRLFAE